MELLLKLKQIVSTMLDSHQQLLQLAKEKQSILVEGNVSALQNVIGQEMKCTDFIHDLETLREQHIREILAEKGYHLQSITMEQFIPLLDDTEEKSHLTMLTGQLRKCVAEISRLNQNNQELIQMTLSYIQYSLNILMPKEPEIGYGQKSKASSIMFLDAKA
ncbi:flagellar protein FlgN [Neobacillus massiliamazoniensis]|uniref:FlgN family protein n=1 Tax=Neobacillus massiliamazoniensis TaxID=1499688 RepID=A0A0U1NS92_9BACI|nr:flagellar protein FlgN [Neobacillus massiliamazoniensis]CRK80923.1 FlgN family protein [Neobacillus massiliamazoniensis]